MFVDSRNENGIDRNRERTLRELLKKVVNSCSLSHLIITNIVIK